MRFIATFTWIRGTTMRQNNIMCHIMFDERRKIVHELIAFKGNFNMKEDNMSQLFYFIERINLH